MGNVKHDVYGIVLAAGSGRRMGTDIPKQYLRLANLPVLAYSLIAFNKAPSIDAIIIVTFDEEYIRKNILDELNIKKPIYFISGGYERQDSVGNGIDFIKNGKIVAIHDSARPLIDYRVIETSIKVADKYGAAICGMPVKDTIKLVDDKKCVVETPPRDKLWLVQTPQTFQLSLIKKAHTKAIEDGFLATDDSSLVERMGISVRMIKGGYENIKITTPDDIIIAEQLLQGLERDGKKV